MYEEIEIRDTEGGYEAAMMNQAGEKKATEIADTPGDALRGLADLVDELAKID